MIRLDNVNKYFNRHKKNEIHVINNTSLEFDSTGLVSLLGPSGCGKTTLLNVLGGLDKVASGNIYIDNKKITKRSINKIDEIRNINIGYIFQDYKLVETMNVFDNVALSLKLIGYKDKNEIKKRVMYALESVNMDRFKNRPVNMLSGGERQRVGIARAIVKSPKIILADEPTGNLDSKNSLEIMNIIKNISKNYLVILVTHETDLALGFSDRIIEVKDGVIVKDYLNNNKGLLNYNNDNKIFLKDFSNINNLSKENININVYQNDDKKIDLDIIIKNGNIYINSKKRVEVITEDSNIEVINDHYQEIKVDKINNNFDLKELENNKEPKYSSIFKLGAVITYGFRKIKNYPVLKKFLLGGFFLSGMFIFYAISSIFASINIEDKDFVIYNKNYLTVDIRNINVNDYLYYENLDSINYILPTNSLISFQFKYDKFLQSSTDYMMLNGSLSSYNMINNDNLLIGRNVINDYEVVMDKIVIDNIIKDSTTAGFSTYEDFLNHDVYLNDMKPFKIVGISNIQEPNIYMKENMFINALSNSFNTDNMYDSERLLDYTLDNITIDTGRLPINDYEVLLNNHYKYTYNLNDYLDYKINNKKLKIVGFYKDNNNYYYVNNNTIKYILLSDSNNLSIYANDNDEVINYFQNNKINIKDSYNYAKGMYLDDVKDNIISTVIISCIMLGISLIEILLMIRSSFLSRIKEVGIFRAVGVKKSDIYKMFSGEILAITILASFTGISFMTYILYYLCKIDYLKNVFMINILTYSISLLLVLIFNIIVGLIPVYLTIRKTPSEILSRNDVD